MEWIKYTNQSCDPPRRVSTDTILFHFYLYHTHNFCCCWLSEQIKVQFSSLKDTLVMTHYCWWLFARIKLVTSQLERWALMGIWLPTIRSPGLESGTPTVSALEMALHPFIYKCFPLLFCSHVCSRSLGEIYKTVNKLSLINKPLLFCETSRNTIWRPC